MTRRLVIVETQDEERDGFRATWQHGEEVRCDRCKHWFKFDGANYCERLVCREIGLHHGQSYYGTTPDWGCASFSPLAGAEGERP